MKKEIEACCENAPIRIKRNAYLRLLQALREVYLIPLVENEVEIKRMKLRVGKKVDSYVRSVADANSQMSRNVRHAIRDAIEEFYRCEILEKIVYPHIERNVGIEKDELRRELDKEGEALSKRLRSKFKNAITTITSEFVERIQQYTGDLVHGATLDIAGISAEIPCLRGEDFNFADVGNWALNVGGYAFSGGSIGAMFGGPLGMAIGAVAGAVVGLILSVLPKWLFKGTRIDRAKNAAREKVDECARNLFEQMEPKIGEFVAKLSSTTSGGVKRAESKKAAICAMHEVLVASIKELKKIERSVVGLIDEMSGESERASKD